jgi:membrane dipeptidase
MKLEYVDRKSDTAAWAKELGISKEAVDLYVDSDVIDLHIETYLWQRMLGYNMLKRHGRGPFGARIFGQIDIPRAREAHITGGAWSISTNPLRTKEGRAKTFVKNIERLRSIFEQIPDDAKICRNLAEYKAARREGKHGAFFGIQGGNALDRDIEALDLIPDNLITRITLVHLYNSRLGTTSAPKLSGGAGLTSLGADYVRKLNEKKILVDLAHISRDGYFEAAKVHDKSQPLIVTHTGIDAVHKHWRNLTDEQIKVIADTGGTIGIMYQWSFLGGPQAVRVIDHMEHVIKVAGEDYISLGSDWDGFIFPPRDMQTCIELPKLVQFMMDRGWSHERIKKALGGNYLRVMGHLRGEA